MFEPDDLLLYRNIDKGAQWLSTSMSGAVVYEANQLIRYGGCMTCKNVYTVYRNILALQAVAVSLSTRRSIDERSSLGAKPVRLSLHDP